MGYIEHEREGVRERAESGDPPGLGLSEVQVVDAVEVHVFSVPGKCCFPHAKVQVRCVHSLNSDPTLPLHCIQDSLKAANIPLFNSLNKKHFTLIHVKL